MPTLHLWPVPTHCSHRLQWASRKVPGAGSSSCSSGLGKDRILGATIAAHNAGETTAKFVLAMKHEPGLNNLLGTIKAVPKMAEANKQAAGEWKKAHKPERVLGLSQRYHDWMRG